MASATTERRELKQVLADVVDLAYEYYDLTGKPLGVTGEVAECFASALLGLELAPPRSPGYDAIRTANGVREKIQIKGRWKKDGCKWGRVPKIDVRKEFDFVILVLMHRRYDVLEMWEAPRDKVIERLVAAGSKSRNERGSMGVSQFKTIARKVWPTDAKLTSPD